MFFKVIGSGTRVPHNARNRAFLVEDNWDDWGKFRTMFQLVVADDAGKSNHIGDVKLGKKGLLPGAKTAPGVRSPPLPPEFDSLDDGYFSLGQGEAYYEALNALSDELKARVLSGLCDCANNLDLFERYSSEPVMQESLLRDVQTSSVKQRLNRLTRGDAQLTSYRFVYEYPNGDDEPPLNMEFRVIPHSTPPTNVHVLIGRNGVGKTRCMRQLTQTLLGRTTDEDKSPGLIRRLPANSTEWTFAGVVLVSFSAFDNFNLAPSPGDVIPSKQVGLRHNTEDGEPSKVKTFEDLAAEFAGSLAKCREGLRAQRWIAAMETLESDDLFAEADVKALLDLPFDAKWKARAERLYSRLSSGHAIVLLTVTRLIELVDEKTLVLLDEPEGHLHPPLLSAFIRCLSDLLVKRNGVAIVATHSPVVLQEVSQLCAWKLRRAGPVSAIERPTIETFGEGIGVLTREVFSLQVTRAGFHKLLETAVAQGGSYRTIVTQFEGQLGAEARAVIQGLIAQRDRAGEDDDAEDI